MSCVIFGLIQGDSKCSPIQFKLIISLLPNGYRDAKITVRDSSITRVNINACRAGEPVEIKKGNESSNKSTT